MSGTLQDIISVLQSIVQAAIPLFMAMAVAVFLWGIVKYISAAGDESKEKEGRGYIIYGLVGLFVLVCFWGIIQLIANSFSVTTGGSIQVPTLELSGGGGYY